MTTLVERAHEIQATTAPSSTSATFKAMVKAKFDDLWPQAVLALGLSLTVAWTAGLVWLLYLVACA
jgi:hypothetical protein